MSMLPIPVNTNVTVVLGDAVHCNAVLSTVLHSPRRFTFDALERCWRRSEQMHARDYLRDVLLCRVRVGVTCTGQEETKETLQEEGLKQRIDYTSSEVEDRATPQP